MKEVQFKHLHGKFINETILPRFEYLSNKSILITGARGMLGSALAATLLEFAKRNGEFNFTVYLASRNWNGKSEIEYLNSKFNFISNTFARSGELDFNFIIHAASPSNFSKVTNIEELVDINQEFVGDCIGTHTECVTYISSGEVYGGTESTGSPSLTKLIATGDRGMYPLAKLLTERYLTERGNSEGFKLKIMRLFHTFGPGLSRNDGRSFSDFLYAGAEGRPIILKTDGMQIRSFLYLGDAVEAIFHFMERGVNFEIHNIGSTTPVSIRTFAEMVAQITSQKVIIRPESNYVKSPFDSIIPDITSAESTGWTPKIDTEVAISRTLNWIRE